METRCISLHEPYASLLVYRDPKIGRAVKWLETRSWPVPRTIETPFRLVVLSSKKRPAGWWSNIWQDNPYANAPEIARAAVDASLEFEIEGRYWSAEESTNGDDWYHRWRGPLGHVVGSVICHGSVPIGNDARGAHIADLPDEGALPHQQGGLWLIGEHAVTYGDPTRVEDQRPFGDFRGGRYAWLTTDAARTTTRCPRCWGEGWIYRNRPGEEPIGRWLCPQCTVRDENGDAEIGRGYCDPIPMRGHQGLWRPRWPEPTLEARRERNRP